MMMFGWGIVFTVVGLMVLMYLGGVSDDSQDYWVGTILFLTTFALGYVLKTLF